MSYTLIESRLWDVQTWLARRYTVDTAEGILAPLRWYIWTGRASVPFLRAYCEAKTFVIGRILIKGGSYDEIIARLKKRLEVL